MLRYVTHQRNLFSVCLLTFALALTACGGGGGEGPDNTGTGGTPPELPKWPQALAFTDFTGGQSFINIGASNLSVTPCQTCITVHGVARSNVELENLRPGKTSPNWPSPYNDKLYSELPIDYNSKMAVILEDRGSGKRYQYAVQKVEESADAISVTLLKCMVFEVYQDSNTVRFGLLIPKSNKAVNVVMIQSGKPTLPVYEPDGLGAC